MVHSHSFANLSQFKIDRGQEAYIFLSDFDVQCKQAGFLKLPYFELTCLLETDALCVSGEHIVLDAIIAWVGAQEGRSENIYI